MIQGVPQPPIKSQNLVNQVTAEKLVLPPGFYKAIAIDFFTIASAVLVSWLYRQFLGHALEIPFLLLGLGLFMSLSVFSTLLTKDFKRRLLVTIGETVGLLVFFYNTNLTTLVGISIVMYCFFVLGDFFARREIEQGVQINFMRVMRPKFRKMMTAVIFAGIVFYLPQWNPNESFVSRPNYQFMFDWSVKTVSNFYPGVRFDSTMKAFVESFALKELNNDPRYQTLPQADKERSFVATTEQFFATIRKTMAMEVKAEDSFADFTYKAILKVLADWRGQFGQEFLIGWAIVTYLVLRSLGLVFYVVIGTIALGVYHLLLGMNFITITGETRMQEKLQYT